MPFPTPGQPRKTHWTGWRWSWRRGRGFEPSKDEEEDEDEDEEALRSASGFATEQGEEKVRNLEKLVVVALAFTLNNKRLNTAME